VDVETGVVGTVIAVVPLRSAAPLGGAGEETGGPLLVPLSPKAKDNDEDSDVHIVSSIGEASRGRSPPAFGHKAPHDEGKSSSTSTSSSSSSSENTRQSASPPATGAKKDDFVAATEEDEEEEEPESSNYRVTLEEPQATASRLQIPGERRPQPKFLEEVGSSFTIPHEEEYFRNLSSTDLITACGDLSLKASVASRCLAQRLEREGKETKELSVAAATSLQNRVAELEGRLAAEQERNQQLL
jgi:hypothetical protein